MLHDLITEPVDVEAGSIAIPDRPGLGITVREDVVRRYAMEAA
jgi:L-alanine-DL-glutamate epimerase-like enolase superfamily enzyme